MKNKFVNRTICKMVLAGLLLNTLPLSLSMQGAAAPSSPTATTKTIVDQEIKQIRDTVRKLNRLKLYISGITAGVGILAALGIAGVSIVALRYGGKIIAKFQKKFQSLKKKLRGSYLTQIFTQIDTFYKPKIVNANTKTAKETAKDLVESLFSKDLNLQNELLKEIEKHKGNLTLKWWNDIENNILYKKVVSNFNEAFVKKGAKTAKDVVRENLKKEIRFYHPKTLITAGLGGLFVALLTASGALGGIIGSLIGLKRAQAAEAFFGALKLEQMEKKNPGTLTATQKNDIAQLKKLSNNWMVRGYIKGLIIKGVMKGMIDELIKQYPQQVAALGKEKKARKTLSKYIKLSWKAENLQKLLTQEKEHARLMGELLTPDWIKIYKKARASLPKTEKKISALENQHHGLKALAKNVAHRYTTAVNDMLNKLEKTATIQKIAELPTISL